MREKPILFSTEMVQAILDGNKTMTRRIVKPQPPESAGKIVMLGVDELIPGFATKTHMIIAGNDWGVEAPYQPGDHLWVRETFCEVPYEYNHIPIKGGYITVPKYAYKADSEKDYTGIWRPSIHMPKAAARIWLEVTNVRVERLQEINNADRLKEGIRVTAATAEELMNDYEAAEMGRQKFIKLWNSTIKKQDLLKYGWEANPWVFVIEFKRVNHD